MQIIVDALVWFPTSLLGSKLDAVRHQLTVKPQGYGLDEPEPIKGYIADESGELIGVPIDYGLNLSSVHYPNVQIVDLRASGSPITITKFPDPNHERATPGQAKFMEDMLVTLANAPHCALAEAATGTGKTVTCLNTIGKLGVTALVVVPDRSVAQQWSDECERHLGLTKEQIGRVETGQYRFEGCAITIAVVHNLIQKSFPPEFYTYFGFVCWDECHTLGARSFSQSMYMFPARYKLGMSATPERRDKCGPIFLNYFGPPTIVSEAEALPCDCYILTYEKDGKPYPSLMPKARQITCLALDMKRNRFIRDQAILKFWKQERCGLIVSDRVEHLQVLMSLAYEAGIPESAMGLFVRSWTTPEGKKRAFKQDYLEAIKTNADIRLIFATYGMFKHAIDVPRLDAGIDVTPRAQGEQLIGRIRRPLPGKKRPVWLTLRDKGNVLLSRMLDARLRDYRASGNVNIKEYGSASKPTNPTRA